MKKTVTFLLGFGAACLLGIGGWYWVRTSNVESEANEQAARADAARMVPVKIVVKAPSETPGDQDLYLSGSAPTMGNWEAAGVRLEKESENTYAKTIELMSGVEYAFKINRGTWGTVERGPNMGEIDNHTFTADAEKPVEVAVATWVDEGKGNARITLTGTVLILPKIDSKALDNVRDIAVYLPPGYSAGEETH
jgi:hypothetical protein